MPFINPSCNCGWDAHLEGPDVYFQLTNNSNDLRFIGEVFDDVSQAMLPLSYPFSPDYAYQITNFASTYKISVYDKDMNDVPPSSDDCIEDYSFSVSSWTLNGYQTSVTLQSPLSQLKIDLSLHWQ